MVQSDLNTDTVDEMRRLFTDVVGVLVPLEDGPGSRFSLRVGPQYSGSFIDLNLVQLSARGEVEGAISEGIVVSNLLQECGQSLQSAARVVFEHYENSQQPCS